MQNVSKNANTQQFPVIVPKFTKIHDVHKTDCLKYLSKLGQHCFLRGQVSLQRTSPVNSSQTNFKNKNLPRLNLVDHIQQLEKQIRSGSASPKKKYSTEKNNQLSSKPTRRVLPELLKRYVQAIQDSPCQAYKAKMHYRNHTELSETYQKLQFKVFREVDQSSEQEEIEDVTLLRNNLMDQSYKLNRFEKLNRRLFKRRY